VEAFAQHHTIMANRPAVADVAKVIVLVDQFLQWTKENRSDAEFK
jgi:hypothetical protein